MSEYLYAVQDENGREAVSWRGEVGKVSDVTAHRDGDTVKLVRDGETLSSATVADDAELTLYRWPADDKLSQPVSHKVSSVEETE